jgi:hypothetical protein
VNCQLHPAVFRCNGRLNPGVYQQVRPEHCPFTVAVLPTLGMHLTTMLPACSSIACTTEQHTIRVQAPSCGCSAALECLHVDSLQLLDGSEAWQTRYELGQDDCRLLFHASLVRFAFANLSVQENVTRKSATSGPSGLCMPEAERAASSELRLAR